MRKIVESVYWVGAVDWDRRLFDSLVPLPDGTTYNAYLVMGEKITLIDTVKAPFMENFMFPVPEASFPAVEICSDKSQAG